MWTDSTIALHWLHGDKKVDVFVDNRVEKIRQILPSIPWRHIPTDQNPADLTSRGMTAAEFLKSPLYWTGPKLITSNTYPEQYCHKSFPQNVLTLATISNFKMEELSVLRLFPDNLYNNITRLRRVLALVIKATRRMKKLQDLSHTSLSAKVYFILAKAEQNATLSSELQYLHLPKGHRPPLIHPLKLFLDTQGPYPMWRSSWWIPSSIQCTLSNPLYKRQSTTPPTHQRSPSTNGQCRSRTDQNKVKDIYMGTSVNPSYPECYQRLLQLETRFGGSFPTSSISKLTNIQSAPQTILHHRSGPHRPLLPPSS
jgi:hypothetical protein